MSDTVTAPAPPQSGDGKVVLDIDYLRQLGANVSRIDEQIAARSGSEGAIRNSVLNRHYASHSDQVDGLVNNLINQFKNAVPIEVMAGVLTRLPDALEENFSTPVDELIAGEVEKLKETAKGDTTALREQRKSALELFRSVRAILEQIQVDVSSVPEPKRSGGGRPAGGGTSGASKKSGRNKQNYRYYINGKQQPPSQNTFSAWVWYATMGCTTVDDKPDRWTAEKMREFLKENGITWGAPGEIVDGKPADDTFEVELPNEKTVGARRMTDELDADILSDDDSSDSDSSSEETSTETSDDDAPVEQTEPVTEAPAQQ